MLGGHTIGDVGADLNRRHTLAMCWYLSIPSETVGSTAIPRRDR